MFEHETHRLLREIIEELRRERGELRKIIELLQEIAVRPNPATAIDFFEIGERTNMQIPQGGSGTFQEVLTPANGALTSGPVWTADDPAVQLVPSSDGSTLVVNVPVTDSQGSAPAGSPGAFNLTISAVSSNGSALTATHSVTIAPPVAVPATAIDFTQIA